VLCLKRGWLDTGRLTAKYGVDPLEAWRPQWRTLEEEGFVDLSAGQPRLSRPGLLQVDSLLARFFEAA
jgi:hypothetical protein